MHSSLFGVLLLRNNRSLSESLIVEQQKKRSTTVVGVMDPLMALCGDLYSIYVTVP